MRKFSKVVVPICISIGLPVAPLSLTFVVVSPFRFSHFSGSSSLGFQFAFLCLMTNDAEHFLTCVFYICRSPFVKWLCFLPILKRVICLFFIELQESIYILGFRSFVMCYEYLLTCYEYLLSVACLFFLHFLISTRFYFWWSPVFSFFSFVTCTFCVFFKITLLI